MLRRFGFLVLVLLLPSLVRAADLPERSLPAGTQVYLRWDGIDAHRAAYEKMALGQILKGDTGQFVSSVVNQLQDLLGGAIVQELLQGTPPEQLQKIQADAAEAPKMLKLLGKNGIIIAGELRGLETPDGQVTVILPNAGDDAKSVLATLRLAMSLSKQQIKERTISGRTVYQVASSPLPVGWWLEGKDFILTVGTQTPETFIKGLQGPGAGPRLTENPLFQRLHNFKQFTTGTRTFLDVASLNKLVGKQNKDVGKLLHDAGLDSVKSLVFYSGFDGPAEHGLMEMSFTGEPRGALRLLSGKPFTLADVPPIPPDALSFTMTNLDLKVVYDEGLPLAESVAHIASPEDAGKIKALVKQADEALGINVRKDLLESLGDQFVQYNSAGEGPIFFGQTYLLKVKDPKKLEETLEQALKGVGKLVGVDITTKKRTYHGVTLTEVHVPQQGFFLLPTYTIHKGWLVASYYPQAVQGYVLRANGELPAWKPDESTQEALDKLPKDFLSITVSDPRPTVKQLLTLAPLVAAAINSASPNDTKLDVGLLPNANEATRHLFPNVSVVTREGGTLRVESRASLALPIDLGGTDSLVGVGLLLPFRIANK